MKRFRVTGNYEADGEPVSLVMDAQDETAARDRATTEGLCVSEIRLDVGTRPPSATLADALLYVGFGGSVISCVAAVGFAIYAFTSGRILVGFLSFPLGCFMAAANAMLFKRVLDLSAGVTDDN